MRETRIIMGMPVTIDVIDTIDTPAVLAGVFDYFEYVDATFSTYKPESEISRINKKEVELSACSADMQKVFRLCAETKQATNGFFNIIARDGSYDPSGLVKGWAIHKAAEILKNKNIKNCYVEAGGDIQVSGTNTENSLWRVGICNPFDQNKIVKVVALDNVGMATSGTYVRGQHIYNPHDMQSQISGVVSLTVTGPNIYEADRFATAAFAMGRAGIEFIEQMPGLEGYMIDDSGMATMTSGFDTYVIH